ncbi:MAF1 protein [Panaeolus papilionaceus]|nr:MAF1 protein [Panaeolus papilionaceus]
MKYIEIPALSHLAQSLTHEGPECSVHTRMEAYSCKNVKRDKKLFKELESAYQEDVSTSPPLPSWLALDREAEMTPFGPIDKQSSRKTLYLLIATLNIAFPDYEFSDVKASHFVKEQDGANILNALSNTLISPHKDTSAPRSYSSYPPTSSDFFPSTESSSTSPYERRIQSPLSPPPIVSGTHPTLFRLIDDVIGLSECEVFSYTPEIDADPHANDFSDDEDDVASVADEASSSDEDPTFEFDNYDIDEVKPRRYSGRTNIPPPTPRAAINYSFFDELALSGSSPTFSNLRFKRKGVLLWSSHWFFLNRKKKRILFVSVWSRSRGIGRMYTGDEEYDMDLSASSERFKGWEGSVGLGARAFGIKA